MSEPLSFFDPFASRKDVGNDIRFGAPPSESLLPVTGQGIIAVSSSAKVQILFVINCPKKSQNNLYLQIGAAEISLSFGPSMTRTESIPTKLIQQESACYLNPGVQTTYWLSIDGPNGVLRYGKYYTNKSMTLLEATLKKEEKPGVPVWISSEYSWLADLKDVDIVTTESAAYTKVIIHPLPVVIELSPFIISSQDASLPDLNQGKYAIPVNLPQACQVLYGNVAGPNIILDTPAFPDFSAAIERSVSTPGLWGHTKLMEKSTEFGSTPNFEGTYLRITIGHNLGDSPGIPFVLEIWPAGHYSPIHDHGNACAVIKVLHGEITARFFDALTAQGGPHMIGHNAITLKKDMVTWLGENDYQVHQLRNTSLEVCCTIQCYRYPDDNDKHYEGFNYIEEGETDGKEKLFIPNSDMAFEEFWATMKAEWDSRKR
ncbi:uncharacterized protein LY89DRAFT_754246 [Mollisia scopiformis]|uniref:cysteine dioxygenase n=1 Tax=Mollisia scopiformis TaxID=149040 RepID=A0A194WZW1_MOLSC|nr:uncharacterized protein LY89DRAFT_754246 [Mollisia scopiformis]KUJ13485.1 hypothetical protein LY89DRAFT_754246 [Mollisia scopiformis]